MGNWPLMILRLTKAFDDCEGVFRRIMELLARHPGSADEIWLCAPSYASPGRVRESFRHAGRLRELCRRHGIRCSFQQGTTLGHGAIDPLRLDDDGLWPFAEEDFSVASDGRRLTGILCPRSPNVQAFAYEYAKAVMETLLSGPVTDKGYVIRFIADGTELHSAGIDDGICYVDLSEEFLNENIAAPDGTSLVVYAIVNSLTALPEVAGVQFLIDGEARQAYLHPHFDQPITPRTPGTITVQ